jgi:hypothetical protein
LDSVLQLKEVAVLETSCDYTENVYNEYKCFLAKANKLFSAKQALKGLSDQRFRPPFA